MYNSVAGMKRPLAETESYSQGVKKQRMDGSSQFENGYMGRWVVRMRGLPYSATVEEVNRFFSDLDITPTQVCLAKLRSGRASGEGLVEFDSQESLEKAYTKNKENFLNDGRYVEMFDSTPDAIDIVSGSKVNFNVAEVCNRNNSVIRMRGMPFTAGTQEVTDFLQLKQIVPVQVHHVKDRIGRPSGMCYVELSSQEDADNALALDKAFMGSRYVEVFASSHEQLVKDVSKGVMTSEMQFPGAMPLPGTFSGGYRGRGFGSSFRGGGRGRGRGGLGYGGRGRAQSSWISTTVMQPPMGRGGRGGRGGRSGGGYGGYAPPSQQSWNSGPMRPSQGGPSYNQGGPSQYQGGYGGGMQSRYQGGAPPYMM